MFLPGESPAGLPSMGSNRVGHDLSDLAVLKRENEVSHVHSL